MENIKLNKDKLVIDSIINQRLGETKLNKFGSKMRIIKYTNSTDIDVEFEDGYVENTQYGNFIRGKVRNLQSRTVCGMGYIGKGKYKVTDKDNKQTKEYATWANMLARCYSKSYKEKHPTYTGCEVCEEWLNFQNFGKWFDENYYEIEDERMELDKDILYKNNKMYSPKTCIFVPQSINLLFIKRDSERGATPVGVAPKTNNKYTAQCSYAAEKSKSLGTYNNIDEAFSAYKKYKEKLIKEAADKFKNKIPKKLYDAMYNYKVQITD